MDGVHVININELVISMTREQNSGWPGDGGGEDETCRNPVIHRISTHLRGKPENAFVPYFLSLGPYNHGIEVTHAMQMTKYEFLNHIVKLKHDKGLPDYLETVKQLERRVRSRYADEISMDNNDFLKMLLLDGCFILFSLKELEWPVQEQQTSNNSNRGIEPSLIENNQRAIINEEGIEVEVRLQDTQSNERREEYSSASDLFYSQQFWHDVLLLENQIPFFLIRALHDLIAGGMDTTSKYVENVVESLEGVLGCYPSAICKSNRPKNFHHLLHLCHLYLQPSPAETDSDENHRQPHSFRNFLHIGSNFFTKFKQRSSPESSQAWQQESPWYRATEYRQAGIMIKKRIYCPENPHSLLDIVFCNNILEVPCLTIDPNTYSLFCNLIAFEQTCPQFGSSVTSYIMFLSRFISKPDDVSLLTERSITVHQLNSDADVSNLFKTISECVVSDFDSNSYLQPLCHRLTSHYQSQRPVLRELLGSITSKLHGWTQRSATILPISRSTGVSISEFL